MGHNEKTVGKVQVSIVHALDDRDIFAALLVDHDHMDFASHIFALVLEGDLIADRSAPVNRRLRNISSPATASS
jgi:hypothetical protein